jgi:hypothetical protein
MRYLNHHFLPVKVKHFVEAKINGIPQKIFVNCLIEFLDWYGSKLEYC